MEEQSTGGITPDPFEAVADAMQAAAEEVDEAEAPSDPAPETRAAVAPPPGQLVSKTVYVSSYYLSFGVVFGALMVASIVPTDNALGAGLRDGAAVANDAVKQRAARRAARQASQAVEDMNELIDALPEEGDPAPA